LGEQDSREVKVSKVTVNLLGAGAVKISGGEKVIYVDAFSEWLKLSGVTQADLILITHDDGDHFGASETAQAALDTGATVVGPPGIAYPLLADEGFPKEQLRIIYPIHFKQPVTEEVSGVRLKVYQTTHFVDWHPPHVSYLLELAGKRIYVTGYSYVMDDDDPDLQRLDAILYSLVPKDLAASGVVEAHVAALEDVQSRFGPRYVLPSHLVDCDWTVEPADLKRAIQARGLENIVVLETKEETFEIA
jgi:L-ascorbate metabolism protein UlaG (beta-lactamase superfamily)